MELFTPSFGLVFWMFVVFVLLCLLLGKFAWPAIIKMMSERADLIDKGVAYAQEAKQHMDNARLRRTSLSSTLKSNKAKS